MAQKSKMEKLISRNSRKTANRPADEIRISTFDLDYAYGQVQLSKRAMDSCIFAKTGENLTSYYRFLMDFLGIADNPTLFHIKGPNTGE